MSVPLRRQDYTEFTVDTGVTPGELEEDGNTGQQNTDGKYETLAGTFDCSHTLSTKIQKED